MDGLTVKSVKRFEQSDGLDTALDIKSTFQPFHRDSCDILTKNNIRNLHKFYNIYSGL